MLKENHIKKLKAGRLKHFEENQGLICRINNQIEIWADKNQFILKINNQVEGYFSDIILVLDELLLMKEKQLMLASEEKDLLSVKQAIQDSRAWIEKIVKPILHSSDNNEFHNIS